MVDKKTIRLAAACCCFCQWFSYYSFLNNFIRGFQICVDVFESISDQTWKIIFSVFMCCCCGFQCMCCALCIFTCIDLFGEPCQAYQEADTWIEAFHTITLLKNCEMEAKIKDTLKGIFVK